MIKVGKDMKIQQIWPEWTIEQVIGKGAFGIVYRIRKGVEHRAIYSALKIIHIPINEGEIAEYLEQGMDENSIRSLLQEDALLLENEIKIMISLKSSINVVSIEDYAIVEDDDGLGWTFYIRLELLESLSSYVQRNGGISPYETLQMGIDISNALASCEKAGIIHRDVKPGNIFRNNDGAFKLGDFGIAKQLQESTSTYTQIGTPSFEAPEIIRGQKYDNTIDIYALGIILYTYLNRGRKPFMPSYPNPIRKTDIENALRRRMSGEPMVPPIDAPSQLSEIILKACAYYPRERYQSAKELRQDLLNFRVGGVAEEDLPTERLSMKPKKEPLEKTQKTIKKQNKERKPPQKNNTRKILTVLYICGVAVVAALGGYLLGSGRDDSTVTVAKVEGEKEIESEDENTPEEMAKETEKPVPLATQEVKPTSTSIPELTVTNTPTPKPTATSTPTPTPFPKGYWNTVTPLEKAEIGNIVKMGHEYSYINDATNSTPSASEMEWYVIDKDGDSLLLMSKYGLSGENLSNISIDSWLNIKFFNYVFTQEERSKIVLTTVGNNTFPYNVRELKEDESAERKVFLLSSEEYSKYFTDRDDEVEIPEFVKKCPYRSIYAQSGRSAEDENAGIVVRDSNEEGVCVMEYNPTNGSWEFKDKLGVIRPVMWVYKGVTWSKESIIRNIQKELNKKNYYCGPAGGFLNYLTSLKLKEYQIDHNLPVTGLVTEEVRGSLGV